MIVNDVRLAKYNGGICLTQVAVTSEDVALIRASFAKIAPIADSAVALFYRKLFAAFPEVRHLFTQNLESQQRKFTQMLSILVDKLDTPEVLADLLQDLGRRHAGYDVKNEHYDKVGEILLATFAELLGNDGDAKTLNAWASLYRLATFLMQNASASPIVGANFFRVMIQGVLVAQYGADVIPRRIEKSRDTTAA